MRIPPLLADFIYSSDCKLICEKSLTLPYLATGTFPRKSDLAVIGNRPVSPSVGETPVKPYLIALPFLGNYVVQQAIHPALLYGDSNWSPLARLISLKSVVQRNNLLKS